MIQHRCYRSEEWHNFGKQLLERKGGEEQKAFLRACRSRDEFLEYLDDQLPIVDIAGENALGSFNYNFCENEFREPPTETQRLIWEAF